MICLVMIRGLAITDYLIKEKSMGVTDYMVSDARALSFFENKIFDVKNRQR